MPSCAGHDSLTGLSELEALARLRTDGSNELPTQERRTFLHALVFAGTLVVQGTAIARVTATGERPEMGRIGRSLGATLTEDTRRPREPQGSV